MSFLKKLKWLLYPAFFFVVFVLALYFTFPANALKDFVANAMQESLSKEAGVRLVTPPKVTIEDLDLWWLSGVSMDRVNIQMGSETPDPGPSWSFEKLKVRAGILSSLSGKPRLEFSARLYSGSADGAVVMTPEGGISYIWLDIDSLDLKKFSNESKAQLPFAGKMSVNTEFNLGKDPARDGDGQLTFNLKGFELGPGKFPIPDPMFTEGVSVPAVKLGDLTGKLSLKKGKGKTEGVKFTGGDIELNADVEVDLAKNIGRSRVDGSGWFRIDQAFLKSNPMIQSLFELSPEIKNAQEPDGKVYFSLKGTLDRPRPRFGRDKGPVRDPVRRAPPIPTPNLEPIDEG